jgi:hypothetical protein
VVTDSVVVIFGFARGLLKGRPWMLKRLAIAERIFGGIARSVACTWASRARGSGIGEGR